MNTPRDPALLSWTLSVDLGTTATAAAVAVAGERRVVELDGRSSMPSTVLAPPEGALVVGVAAEAQAALHPERVERTPKRRLGDPVMLLGERAVEPVEAIAAILGHVAAAATSQLGGTRPTRLVLTHPARWGSRRLGVLREAARRCDLPEPALVPEPVAAAAQLALDLAGPGDLLAVYDLGGGTLDVAIVRRTDDGFVLAGPPGGDDTLGGESLDERIVGALLPRLDPSTADRLRTSDERSWQQARLQLRRDARSAKEALSNTSHYEWYAGSPVDAEFGLTAAELEQLIGEPVQASVEALLEVVRRAGLQPDALHSVVMVGGSARAPIVGRMLTAAIGRPPTTWGDPKAAVCLGALAVLDREGPVAPSDTGTPSHTAPPDRDTTPPTAEPEPEPDPEPGTSTSTETDVPIEATPERTEPTAPTPPLPEPPVDPGEEPSGDPGEETPVESTGWSRERIGATIGLGLVSLGLVSAILAALAR